MKESVKFEYPVCGKGRPQIVLIGNGLEYKSGQVAWKTLVDHLTLDDSITLTEDEKKSVPFPLLYEVIVMGKPIPRVLDAAAINWEEKHLEDVFERLGGNLDGKGPGAMRRIPQEDLDQLKAIFDITGATERIRRNRVPPTALSARHPLP